MYSTMADIQQPVIRKEPRLTDNSPEVSMGDLQRTISPRTAPQSFSGLVFKALKLTFVILMKSYFALVFGVCAVVSSIVSGVYQSIAGLFSVFTPTASNMAGEVEYEEQASVHS